MSPKISGGKKTRAEVTVRIVKRVRRSELLALYEDAGWWSPGEDETWTTRMIKNTWLIAGAFHNGVMIGMGRVLSDGVSDAYIQDVVVLRAFRGRGIGSRIVRLLTEKLREEDIDWSLLVAAPGAEKFYRKLGFERMKDFVPMRLRF
jgi:spermidine synthase